MLNLSPKTCGWISGGHVLVEAGDVGEAAAEDDDVGVEDVDDDGERAAEAVLVAAQGLLGGGVAGGGEGDDLRRRVGRVLDRDAVAAGVVGGEVRAGEPGLDVAGDAAGAERAGALVVERARAAGCGPIRRRWR